MKTKLRTERVNALRDALVQAGLSRSQIETGTYADPQTARQNQVKLVLRTVQ